MIINIHPSNLFGLPQIIIISPQIPMSAFLFVATVVATTLARTSANNKSSDSDRSVEGTIRYDLSVAHKACNYFGMDELVWNHISARHGSRWLITPGRRMWDAIEPSDIVSASDNCTA